MFKWGKKKMFHLVKNILKKRVFMAGHRLVALLHLSNPKKTEFPFSSAISILYALNRKERAGYQEVNTTSAPSVYRQQT